MIFTTDIFILLAVLAFTLLGFITAWLIADSKKNIMTERSILHQRSILNQIEKLLNKIEEDREIEKNLIWTEIIKDEHPE